MFAEKWYNDAKTRDAFFQNVTNALKLEDEYGIEKREKEILQVLTSIFDQNAKFTVSQAQGFISKFLEDDETHSGDFRKWIKAHRDQIAETFSTAVNQKDYNAATTSQDFMNAIYDEANASLLKNTALQGGDSIQKKEPRLASDGITDADFEDAAKEAEKKQDYRDYRDAYRKKRYGDNPSIDENHVANVDRILTVLGGKRHRNAPEDEIRAYLSSKTTLAWLTDEEKEEFYEYIDKKTLDRAIGEVEAKILDRTLISGGFESPDVDEYIEYVREYLRLGTLPFVKENTEGVLAHAEKIQWEHKKAGLVKLAEGIGINCEGATINDVYELIRKKVREAAETGGIEDFSETPRATTENENTLESIVSEAEKETAEQERLDAEEALSQTTPEEYAPPKKQPKAESKKTAEEYLETIKSLVDKGVHSQADVEHIMNVVDEGRKAHSQGRIVQKTGSILGLKKRPEDKGSIYQLPVGALKERIKEELQRRAQGIVDQSKTTAKAEKPQSETPRVKRGMKARNVPQSDDFEALSERLSDAKSRYNGDELEQEITSILNNFQTELKFGVEGLRDYGTSLGLHTRGKSLKADDVKKRIADYL